MSAIVVPKKTGFTFNQEIQDRFPAKGEFEVNLEGRIFGHGDGWSRISGEFLSFFIF